MNHLREMRKMSFMKNVFIIISIVTLCFTINSCKKQSKIIITENGSTRDSLKVLGVLTKPIELMGPKKNWYTPLVIILDSTDKVYIYQTETISKPCVLMNSFQKYDYDNEGDEYSKETEYSNYIGLRPEHMLTFESTGFISFIKNNQDIFKLDTLVKKDSACYFTIASNKDTISNIALYDILKLITTKIGNSKDNRIAILLRKTTEEENVVVFHKRNNIEYNPRHIKWSYNFIDGKSRPFTKDYELAESTMIYKTRAINSINMIWSKIRKTK